MNRTILRIGNVLMILSIGLLDRSSVLAHDTGSGEDVGYIYMKATPTNNLLEVEIDILEPDPCDIFQPDSMVAQRAEQLVSAPLTGAGPCHFQGTIELPESGRWTLTTQLLLNGRLAQASLPVSVGSSTDFFESETWLHADKSVDASSTSLLANLLSYSLYGVVAIALALLTFYFIRSRRAAPPSA